MKRTYGFSILGLFAFFGFHDCVGSPLFPADLLVELGATLAAVAYTVRDLETLGRPIPKTAEWLLFSTWPIAAPILLLAAHRGERLRILAQLFLVVLVYVLGYGVGVVALTAAGSH